MDAGDAFSHEQLGRLQHAQEAAEKQTGVSFSVRIGDIDGNPSLEGERMLANIVGAPRNAGVLILVSPGQRVVHVVTSAGAQRRISDHAAGLAVLTMTSSFSVGDLVGGIVNGLRQLADAAGAGGGDHARASMPPAHAALEA